MDRATELSKNYIKSKLVKYREYSAVLFLFIFYFIILDDGWFFFLSLLGFLWAHIWDKRILFTKTLTTKLWTYWHKKFFALSFKSHTKLFLSQLPFCFFLCLLDKSPFPALVLWSGTVSYFFYGAWIKWRS